MADKENVARELADDMITDPDKDAEATPPPKAPQTVANEDSDRPREPR